MDPQAKTPFEQWVTDKLTSISDLLTWHLGEHDKQASIGRESTNLRVNIWFAVSTSVFAVVLAFILERVWR